MRAYLVWFLMLCIGSVKSQQISADFPDSNYFYNESRYKRLSDMFLDFNYIDYSIYYKKDTVVNNMNYHLLNIKFSTKYFAPPIPSISKDISYALLRNDKANKKVYITGLNKYNDFNLDLDTNERLLFDFDLKVGDLYKANAHLYYGNENDTMYVLKIDTIIDPDNIKRAVFTIGNDSMPFNHGYIIQGIGGVNGLLGFIKDVMDNSYSEDFTCYSINEIDYTAYFSEFSSGISYSSQPCNKHTFVSIENLTKSQINIYPNPVISKFYIDHKNENSEFELINTIGQTFKINGDYVGNKWEFEMNAYNNGVYILKIVSDGKIYFSKISKI